MVRGERNGTNELEIGIHLDRPERRAALEGLVMMPYGWVIAMSVLSLLAGAGILWGLLVLCIYREYMDNKQDK